MEKSDSRTINSRNNFITGVIGQLLVLVMSFICRTVFVRTLGKEYLGINGVFSHIISFLSLTELGIGTAIVFNLYKPIAEKDESRIYVLMKFYKQAYRLIGFVVIAIGLVLMPFLPYLAKDAPGTINIYIIFGLYLAQSASSYFFFAYKSQLVRADQRVYIINMAAWVSNIALNIAQILSLLFLRNFEIYVALSIVSSILVNIYISKVVDKLFPYVKEKRSDKLSWQETQSILKDCLALSLWHINTVVTNTAKNIILSGFIGFAIVGLYSNFLLISTNIVKFLDAFFNAIAASIGNLNATANKRNHEVYNATNLLTAVMYAIVCLGFYFVANPFVTLWLSPIFRLDDITVLLLSIDMYIMGVFKLNNSFKSALGLFKYLRLLPIIGAVVNVAVSILLVKPLGISGVILGAIIGNFFVFFLFDPIIVFKHGFKESWVPYFIRNFLYIGIIIAIGCLIRFIVVSQSMSLVLTILVAGSLSVVLPILVFTAVFWKSAELTFLKKNVLTKVLKIH